LLEATGRLLGGRVASEIQALVQRGPSTSELRRLERSLRELQPLSPSEGRTTTAVRTMLRELRAVRAAIARRWLPSERPRRRVLPQGGVLVALVGSDGSGKSTLTKDLSAWLSWKIDVLPLYFGSGDGPSSLARWPLKLALPLGRRLFNRGTAARRDGGGGHRREGRSALETCLRAVWALAVAREKRARLRT